MLAQHLYRPMGCAECANGTALEFDFSMAFQPIVDIAKREVFAYEALARGLNGEPAGEVFKQVNEQNRYKFDQTCRVKAVKLASELGMQNFLSINFMPNAVYKPELCIRTTLNAAAEYNFPVDKIVFEFTEDEEVINFQHLANIVDHYKQQGFKTAIDDFGAGHSGMTLLANVHPDIIKIDMALIRDIEQDKRRQLIVKSISQLCADLSIEVIVEGVETEGEYHCLEDLGIRLIQGYYLAHPMFETLPAITLPPQHRR